ncbi:sirohydrochlorin chelatase [Saccharopolyspora sp. HNM0983]|uniref:Sirohydrochlorin chelatase n=1 Tax=Saccharopolyspora montiporae TaxID=2781240 RepID=A0A929BBC8_9PSEU|nr:sirohydrochlorin chelatase [Saccharopolyspora sp. HNM0983]MBE9374553.1 sirohydrochlorin chelatase [Saccharopolyspora sp. HNM0983]
MTAPLVAVAHGSRDPRSAATIQELAGVLRDLRPDLDVRVAFLDLSAPRVGDVISAVHGSGHTDVVVVPLLLGRAFHARVDVPAAVAEAQQRYPRLRVHVSDVLGPNRRLESAARRRLAEAGAADDDPDLGVLLAGAGSSDAGANQLVRDVAQDWQQRTSWTGALASFAAAADPDVPAAVQRLRERGARRFAVASWFLAPGLLPDRITRLTREHAPGSVIAEPMGADPGVADLVLQRHAEALAAADHPVQYSRAQ